jgi:hypothetical protein
MALSKIAQRFFRDAVPSESSSLISLIAIVLGILSIVFYAV